MPDRTVPSQTHRPAAAAMTTPASAAVTPSVMTLSSAATAAAMGKTIRSARRVRPRTGRENEFTLLLSAEHALAARIRIRRGETVVRTLDTFSGLR